MSQSVAATGYGVILHTHWGVASPSSSLPTPTVCLGTSLIPTSSSTTTEPVIKPTVAKSNQVADVTSSSSLTGVALLSMLIPKENGDGVKSQKACVGAGLPSIPRRVHDRMLKWEFVNLAEFHPPPPPPSPGTLEAINPKPDPQQYAVIPGLELASAKKKLIQCIHTWFACFTVYTAVMAKAWYPNLQAIC